MVGWDETSVLRGWEDVEMDGLAGVARFVDSGCWDARSQRRQSRQYYAINSEANGASDAVLSVWFRYLLAPE